jgi:NitT/TauT family transport system substrate-binding protein
MKKFISILIILLVSLMFLSGCVSEEKIEKPKENPTVKIGYIPTLGISTPIKIIAQENQLFEKEGIKADFIEFQSSNHIIEALIRGDIDLSEEISYIPFLLSEIIENGKIKTTTVAANPENGKNFDSIITQIDSDINTLKDLEGKKIGVFPGSTGTNILKKFLINKGLDVSKIQFIQITPPQQLLALFSRSIDALHAYDPTHTIAIKVNKAKMIYPSIYVEVFNYTMGGSFVSKEFIKKNPQLAKKSIDALLKAFSIAEENDALTRQLLAEKMKLDKEVTDSMVILYFIKYNNIDEQWMQNVLDKLYEFGEISKKLNVEDLIYKP